MNRRLTVEELAVGARLVGRTPAAPFTPGWAEDERGVAEAVALRGLIARGLVEAGVAGDDPRLTPDTRSELLPLLAPDALVELIVDPTGGPRRRTVLGRAGGERRRAVEQSPGLWRVDGADDLDVEPGCESTVEGVAVRIGRSTVDEVERLLAGGGAEFVPALLERSGVDSPHETSELLRRIARITTIRAVAQPGPDQRLASAYTWLETTGHGFWEITVTEDDDYLLEPTSAARIRAALADARELVGPTRPTAVAA